MSRHKTDPVERAFDAFIALTDQQRAEYDSMLRGYHRAKQNRHAGAQAAAQSEG